MKIRRLGRKTLSCFRYIPFNSDWISFVFTSCSIFWRRRASYSFCWWARTWAKTSRARKCWFSEGNLYFSFILFLDALSMLAIDTACSWSSPLPPRLYKPYPPTERKDKKIVASWKANLNGVYCDLSIFFFLFVKVIFPVSFCMLIEMISGVQFFAVRPWKRAFYSGRYFTMWVRYNLVRLAQGKKSEPR